MYQSEIRNIVALVIVFGHVFVFIVGFFLLGIFGPLFSEDTLQVILMASPVLGVSATAAVKYILRTETKRSKGKIVSGTFSLVTIAFPTILLCVILGLFWLCTFSWTALRRLN